MSSEREKSGAKGDEKGDEREDDEMLLGMCRQYLKFATNTHSSTAEVGLGSISRESVAGEKMRLKYIVVQS